jgi:lipid-A-disaccharide synthase-like uncharacterized protein
LSEYFQSLFAEFQGFWPTFFLLFGLLAQLMFTMRFLIQWIVSERARKSMVPVAFWYFSLLGGIMLFIYAVWRQDPVIMLGQATGIIIYARNLILIYRENGAADLSVPEPPHHETAPAHQEGHGKDRRAPSSDPAE